MRICEGRVGGDGGEVRPRGGHLSEGIASAGMTPSRWPEPETPCRMPVSSVRETDGSSSAFRRAISIDRLDAAWVGPSLGISHSALHSLASEMPLMPMTMMERPTTASM